MKNVQTLVLAVIGGVVVLVGGIFLHKESASPSLGAATGPDSFFPCESHNGLFDCFDRKSFNTASTTLCSFKSPTATSTLRFAQGTITTATSTATQFEWGRSTQLDSTSTSLGLYNLAASKQATILASTTPYQLGFAQTSDYAFVVPPNTFVNLKYGNTLGSANSLAGWCSVRFEY